MAQIFFIADTHFGDSNIIRYENRPFKNVQEMDFELTERWNSVVSENDIVYVLGDFSEYENSKALLTRLNGAKYLIKGNHDTKCNEHYRRAGFKEVYDVPIIIERFWILSHEPLYVNKNMPYANIFGHVHNSPIIKDCSNFHCCVSAERINYTPIPFEKIKFKLQEKKEMFKKNGRYYTYREFNLEVEREAIRKAQWDKEAEELTALKEDLASFVNRVSKGEATSPTEIEILPHIVCELVGIIKDDYRYFIENNKGFIQKY